MAVSSFIFAHSQEPLDHTSSTPNGITLEFPVTACENIDSIPHQDAGRNVSGEQALAANTRMVRVKKRSLG